MKNDFKQFTKRITVNATPQQIYNAWTTQEGLEQWFLKLAEFTTPDGRLRKRNEHCKKGDVYKWLWFGYPDSVFEAREIIDSNGTDSFKFVFSAECNVTVVIKQEAGETICQLVQDMLMDDIDKREALYSDCGTGWTFYLANLKSILEGGIDLRNKNDAVSNVVNS
ncbi:SRPBCC family protein [Foetidibacter luteolus]|uniref:SRPBCC family protein n=1 Tax=Foetidibacter luteolus TaxID=2608880 RepID=UPI00129A86BF|nr:SRPBCC domain-containing protein [Foetidibacter luteolus]